MATIIEDFEDNHSKSSSYMALEGTVPTVENLKYNVTIKYFIDNDLGAKIYIDPLGRFAARIEDRVIEFVQEVLINV